MDLDECACLKLGEDYRYIQGNCYYIEGTSYNITEASENCRNRFQGLAKGGRLFEPMITILNDKVIQEARKTVTTSHNFLLGIQSANSQNNWQYLSNNKNVSWFNWHSGEPNTQNYNCISTFYSNDYTWADELCSNKDVSICEMTSDGNLIYFTCTIFTCSLIFINSLF